MQAVKLARANDINKLVVWRLDRLGRDSGEYIPVLKTLKRLGVDVASVTQPTEGIFMQEIFGVMAEEESRQLSVRVTASKQRRFEEGKWGTPAPFGYDNQKDPEGGSILRPNMEGPIVTEMFERYASGKHSLSDLLHYLNENDYLKSRGAVSYMLKNPVYLGVVQHGRFARSQFMPRSLKLLSHKANTGPWWTGRPLTRCRSGWPPTKIGPEVVYARNTCSAD